MYKWKAIKTFQDNWNIDAKDFHGVLTNALFDTANLLGASNYFLRRTIKVLAKQYPEDVRQLFIHLYNEANDLIGRIEAFQKQCSVLFARAHSQGDKKLNDYQDMRAVYAYLTLRYPEKYCFYKDGMFRSFAAIVDYPVKPIRGRLSNLLHWENLFRTVHDEILKDSELISIHLRRIQPEHYPDPEFLVLTQDIIWTSSHYRKEVDLSGRRIFKLSHGLDDISDSEAEQFLQRKIAVLHKDTLPKVRNGVPQSEIFKNAAIGDLFHLCRGADHCVLIGEFTSEARQCSVKPFGRNGWLEREYSVLFKATIDKKYTGVDKWWSPRHNSTFWEIPPDEINEANEELFMPYFGITVVGSSSDLKKHGPLREVKGRKALVVLPDSLSDKGMQTDHVKKQKANQALGRLGELLVMRYEALKLSDQPRLLQKLRHTSVEEGDGLGYDIESRTVDGKKMFIEVKTTRDNNPGTIFYLTRTEIVRSTKDPKHFYLYRLYNYDDRTDTADMIVICGNLEEELNMEPDVYISKLEVTPD